MYVFIPLSPPGSKLGLICRCQVTRLRQSRQHIFQLFPRTQRQRRAAYVCQRYPSQVSSGLSACLELVPPMESCKFLDLIDEIVQPLPVLALEGVQFGQTRLHWYSYLVWCPGRGRSPIVVLINWCLSAYGHALCRCTLILHENRLPSV